MSPEDPISAARGCWLGVVISTGLWVLIIGALWIIARAIW